MAPGQPRLGLTDCYQKKSFQRLPVMRWRLFLLKK
jgi:hypothetical protein